MYNFKTLFDNKKNLPQRDKEKFSFYEFTFLKKHFLLFYLKDQKRRNHETQKN
jgi:hypothetical protein